MRKAYRRAAETLVFVDVDVDVDVDVLVHVHVDVHVISFAGAGRTIGASLAAGRGRCESAWMPRTIVSAGLRSSWAHKDSRPSRTRSSSSSEIVKGGAR